MNLTHLRDYAKKAIKKHPELKDDISEIYSMACDEVELEGESESNEVELAINEIVDLLKQVG